MKTFPDLVICPHCDTVHRRPSLTGGELAACCNCSMVICRTPGMDVRHWFALAVIAAMAFVAANAYPVMSVDLYGQHNQVTLMHALIAMAHTASSPVAMLLAIFMIITPFIQSALLAWVLLFACYGRRAPALATLLRALAILRPWSMADICLLGILVTAIKLSNLLEVTADAGMAAMSVLALLMIVITRGDTQALWDMTQGKDA
jgi:paraquat-inducible protein A